MSRLINKLPTAHRYTYIHVHYRSIAFLCVCGKIPLNGAMEHLFLHTLLLLLKWMAIAEDPLHPKLEMPADPVHPYAHTFERENAYHVTHTAMLH